MQTGTISFCDKFALNVKSEDIKKNILKLLEEKYNIKILNKHFEIFKEDVSVAKLEKCPYMFCLKSNGNPYLMFLTRINSINTCILIDKKIQQGYFLPRMIVVHMMFDEKLFDNTLLDGEMVKDNSKNWVYLINDMYVYAGTHLVDNNLIKRHNMIYNMLKNEYKNASVLFWIQVKRLFKLNELGVAIDEYRHELPYTSRGVLFKPMFIKFKDILYNFDNSVIKLNTKSKFGTTNEYIDQTINSIALHKDNTTVVSKHNEKQVFNIRNTQTPDIYHLYKDESFVGNACVNTLAVSRFLSNLFKDAHLHTNFNVVCVYNTKFDKWTPISQVP